MMSEERPSTRLSQPSHHLLLERDDLWTKTGDAKYSALGEETFCKEVFAMTPEWPHNGAWGEPVTARLMQMGP